MADVVAFVADEMATGVNSLYLLHKDLQQRTSLTIHQMIGLLGFCLNNTYFVFQGTYHEQIEGAAMESPISPIVPNLHIEEFEAKALGTAPHCPSLWKRFIDDTFVVIKAVHKDEFLQLINFIDEGIQFTAENTKEDGSMPFLDTLVIPQSDGSLMTTVYRKPTNTDQYLQWDSHHAISAKNSVINTLCQRANAVCSNQQHLHEEGEDLQKVLTRCKYPEPALKRMKKKINAPVTSNGNNKKKKKSTSSNISNTKKKLHSCSIYKWPQ